MIKKKIIIIKGKILDNEDNNVNKRIMNVNGMDR